MNSFLRAFRHPLLSASLGFIALSIPVLAQPVPAPAPATDAAAPAPGQEDRRNRRDFNPEEMRTRMLTALREQFQPENDEEWAIIVERMQKVNELRRNNLGGMMGAMMGGGGFRAMMGQGGRPTEAMGAQRGRLGMGSSPETEALQAAIKSNAPAAELKARLERLREVRKENEAKLVQAQEELRGVLNLRQEAVAVMAGLLP
ncbi:MAG: hypothetical protein U1F61_26460 [Opitutaceae bacterium]